MYFGCNKCKDYSSTNRDDFFENQGRCPSCMEDHESMLSKPEWQQATITFECGATVEDGFITYPRGMILKKDTVTFFANQFYGEIDGR